MTGTKEIKARIKGVKNIKQITRAMQMVAVAKLKKFQNITITSRPYEYKLNEIISNVKKAVEGDIEHPLITEREKRNIKILLITSDKGLCGGYNTNIIQHAHKFIERNRDKKISLTIIGKKGYDFFKRRDIPIEKFYKQPIKDVPMSMIDEISGDLMSAYNNAVYDEINIFFTRFGSPVKSDASHIKLLPIETKHEEDISLKTHPKKQEFILEPKGEDIFTALLPRYIKLQIYKAIIESMTSEHGARMVAMKTATDNADDMLSILSLNYNRARQTTITTAILEVASGAEALNK